MWRSVVSDVGLVPLLAFVMVAASACRRGATEHPDGKAVILNRGSDTMVNVALGWAEAYAVVAPEVSVEVAGGGSGVGIAGADRWHRADGQQQPAVEGR